MVIAEYGQLSAV